MMYSSFDEKGLNYLCYHPLSNIIQQNENPTPFSYQKNKKKEKSDKHLKLNRCINDFCDHHLLIIYSKARSTWTLKTEILQNSY